MSLTLVSGPTPLQCDPVQANGRMLHLTSVATAQVARLLFKSPVPEFNHSRVQLPDVRQIRLALDVGYSMNIQNSN